MKILIVGASGGIGLAIVKAYLDLCPSADIVATHHTHGAGFEHPNIQWVKLDVTNEAEIQQLANKTSSLDVLINAVGFLHSPQYKPEKSIKNFDQKLLNKSINLNATPSILLAKHFADSLRSKEKQTFYIVLSARVGSIKDNKIGGWLSYRTSKAALNMAIKTISIEWRRRLPNCCVLLFHPGTTDTGLSKPFQKNLPEGQLHSTSFTARSLLEIIQKSEPNDSGKFLSFDGSDVNW